MWTSIPVGTQVKMSYPYFFCWQVDSFIFATFLNEKITLWMYIAYAAKQGQNKIIKMTFIEKSEYQQQSYHLQQI